MKLALLMAAALSAAPVTAQAPVIPSPMDVRAIRPIVCGDGGGTAFWIDRDRIITAAHVSDNGACSIGGVPLEVVRVDRDLDFTELRGLPSDVWLAYSCDEPRTGDTFYATGYPISEAYWTTVLVAGVPQDVLVQAFERRVLTYTPSNPAGWEVEAGNVGQHYHRWRYDGAGE